MSNNYHIAVSNGILKDGHQKRMGSAVWQFLWLLDKVTKIDPDGSGLVLGGRPVKLTEIGGAHRITLSKAISRLEKEKYIETKRTPYGLVFRVLKAKKSFGSKVGERVSGNATSGDVVETLTLPPRDVAKRNRDVAFSHARCSENATSNKTIAKTIAMTKTRKVAIAPRTQAESFFKGVLDLVEKRPNEEAKEMLGALHEKLGGDKASLWASVQAFTGYWTELTHDGRRQRWQCQKTFEVGKRLSTWLRRETERGPVAKRGRTIIGLENL